MRAEFSTTTETSPNAITSHVQQAEDVFDKRPSLFPIVTGKTSIQKDDFN
ncbi:hypothetical protein HSB1_42360 [Halogranum salarium B-1]|uniref:Uncharacterized protein n=1 Tax=Halogranum salarium B-1 TaxID=1210908 RepID=J2ZW75_9EURY|nr:hypothetical protein HSB1_42360 [Halogranum salarium B-1]